MRGGHRGRRRGPAPADPGQGIKPGAGRDRAGYSPGNIGDADLDSAVERAGPIAPVPGGIGPMTVATPLEQAAEAVARQLGV
ncbi:hypothetical protein GCM10023084_82350 [Streptomyces lacrimifluminis]|uniref:Tetrahydrofolate dehydrogenase/cyclohydrolase NAD(P)-binding domain-containing protein n=1 Tax=Streptomyces lacrimifluminis TaxID=1500077 RepID=A0A917PDH6_9ACTN|nr:hypothetical protein GCM10012282_81130 [Streptomyces lacrimifluminis]